MPKKLVVILLLAAAGAAGYAYLDRGGRPNHYTGFVEGEDRVLRSEVTGRVLEVIFGEGDSVPANAVVARLDERDIRSRVAAQEQRIAVLDAQIARQQQQIQLTDQTWRQDVNARRAELRQAEAAAQLAERTFAREKSLASTGASTQQNLDEMRSEHDQASSAVDRARDLLARAEAESGSVDVARHELEVLRQQRELAAAQLAGLKVTLSKYVIRAPAVPTVVQTKFIWPGELAQPGTAILAVLDPVDKYVQIYVPVADVDRVRVGRRVEIELDSEPGRRVPGEVSFVADSANFTPEKIETRSDRLGQVYRAKVRILEDVERFQPGTEGNVYLLETEGQGDRRPTAEG